VILNRYILCWILILILGLFSTYASCASANGDDASRGLRIRTKTTSGSTQELEMYRGSYALLIGQSNYTAGWPKLESIPGELNLVASALKAKGFWVEKHLDLNGKQLEKTFEEFIDRYGYKKENRLLFYYSGHGHTRLNGRKGYLVPVDAPNPAYNEEEFLVKSLVVNQILAWARDIEAKHAMFLFDSCFSGTIFKQKDLPRVPTQITKATASPVRQFITAGSADETVPANSVFTPVFIDALNFGWGDLNKDGYISGTELGLYIQEKVPRHTAQSPQYGKIQDYDLSRGDFIFKAGGNEADSVDTTLMESEKRILAEERTRIKQELQELDLLRKLNAERSKLVVERKLLETERTMLAMSKQPDKTTSTQTEIEKFPSEMIFTESISGIEFVRVPGGCYEMGCGSWASGANACDSDETPAHEVCVDDFYIGTYEVTQGQWVKLMGGNPSHFNKGNSYPVERISWNDVQEFIRKINGKSGRSFRLPTEAEWEYACRSGGREERYCGGNIAKDFSWYFGSSSGTTHPVGTKSPNDLGIYDMSGNVWEWVQDWYGENYYSTTPRNNPQGPSSGTNHVSRGGSWDRIPKIGRATYRARYSSDSRNFNIGFRLVLSQESK
jgi:formylglycine-generating enzyme required for sulfatase activity